MPYLIYLPLLHTTSSSPPMLSGSLPSCLYTHTSLHIPSYSNIYCLHTIPSIPGKWMSLIILTSSTNGMHGGHATCSICYGMPHTTTLAACQWQACPSVWCPGHQWYGAALLRHVAPSCRHLPSVIPSAALCLLAFRMRRLHLLVAHFLIRARSSTAVMFPGESSPDGQTF